MAAPRSVFLETFGCQMNVADSEIVLARLAEAGYAPTEDRDHADLVLFNTCAVRDNAEAKVRGRLGDLKAIKARRPGMQIGVMGCMAQREQADLLRRYPHVDLVVGTDQFVHMPQLLRQADERRQVLATAFGDFEDRDWSAKREPGVTAYVTVMRGCNYTCTYCIVPTTRGPEKSRSITQIEDEVRRLVEVEGYAQVTLLGQTVDAYGKTLGDGTSLAGLLRRLHEIPALRRIRFVTSHPKDIGDDLLAAMAELPKVARHLHVPAQSGSDRILRLMGRRYDRDGYLRFVDRARRAMPDVELLSDFITGFPSETDADHAATADLMRTVGFAGAYVFMYSPRPGTPSTRLRDDIADEVKRVRCNDLLAIQMAHQHAWYQTLHGSVQHVLVEGPSRTDPAMLQGRSQGNLNIVLPRQSAAGAGRDHLIGRIVPVRIERSTSLTLFGEVGDVAGQDAAAVVP
jgi:tRNA-2-methylthio-N6-dimethylallyladenosine synthase